MNTIEIIYLYDKVISKLTQDIKNSNFKIQYFLNLLNLKRSFFYKKLNEKRFTNDEIKLLSKHLYPDEHNDYEIEVIKKIIDKSQQEHLNGESQDFENVLATTKKQYGL